MPTLETSVPRHLRLYHTGILGVIYFKARDALLVLRPRVRDRSCLGYWQPVTFIWDYFPLLAGATRCSIALCMEKYWNFGVAHRTSTSTSARSFSTGAGVGLDAGQRFRR
jgi:hypothetical protein